MSLYHFENHTTDKAVQTKRVCFNYQSKQDLNYDKFIFYNIMLLVDQARIKNDES